MNLLPSSSSAIVTLLLASASASPSFGGSSTTMPLERITHTPVVSCGDGSPAVFYTDAYTTSAPAPFGIENKNHIINFMGGGACGSDSSCQAIWEQQPYMLSSLFEPAAIDGATILSNDASANPAMVSFTKWNVPYCSQDLWLGNSNQSDNFIRSGSKHVEAMMSHWLDAVLEAQAVIDTLVISGVSAGGMAVLNHFDLFHTVAQAAGVKSLRLILDSSLYPDGIDTDFSHLLQQVVDPQQHPLCFDEMTGNLQHETLSRLPCCLSTHCMLRHSNIGKWAHSSPTSNQRGTKMLLIDSAYDSLQTFIELSSNALALPPSGLSSLAGVASTTFNAAEFAGKRKSRVIETMFGGGKELGHNVFWAVTSFPGHNVLVPSIDLSSRLCAAMQESESTCEGTRDCVFSNYPGGISPVCNATGSGLKLPLGNGLHATLWTTTESWNLITVNGRSIQEVISQFVAPAALENTSASIFSSSSNTLLIDSCPGPNCIPEDSTATATEGIPRSSPAQSLIEIDNILNPMSTWLRASVIIFLGLGLILFSFTLPVCKCELKVQRRTRASNKSSASVAQPKQRKTENSCSCNELYLNGLSVFSNSGDQILDDVSLDLKGSTLNCLLGKSGSGKSCLLGVLSRQLRSNLKVQFKDGTDLTHMDCTYMRQQDRGMENMTSNDYLHMTARVYGTSDERLNFILNLARPFFPVKTERLENGDSVISFDPFNNVPLKELSGGQRRMISIATALFQETSVLLLDEALSGLDSASSEKIIDMLKSLAKDESIIVLLTLHQPSDDILSKMDKVMIMGSGRILFAGDHLSLSGPEPEHGINIDSDKSKSGPSDTVHRIISANELCSSTSMLTVPSGSASASSSSEPQPQSKNTSSSTWTWQPKLRLWQVRPLLRRLHFECPPGFEDIIVLPVCFVVISLWGSFNSSSPLQEFLITACLSFIPVVLFQKRLVMNWGILECHLWDLEDNRISAMSYVIASGIHMFSPPIVSIIVSFSLAFAISNGWDFGSFLDVVLFSIMLTISHLQFGKMLTAALPTYQAVAGGYSVYTYLGSVVSGIFVNPTQIPSYLHGIMYMSLSFWGISGAELSQLEHIDIGNDQCLTFISCIAYNRNVIANLSGYTMLTTAQKSMTALFVATILLVVVEYCFLMKKVSRRGNYKQVGVGAASEMKSGSCVEIDSAKALVENTAHSTESAGESKTIQIEGEDHATAPPATTATAEAKAVEVEELDVI